MKYQPSFTIEKAQQKEQELKKEQVKQVVGKAVDEIYNLPRNPVSDTTSFIVKSTTIDLNDIEDPKFKEQMQLFILTINKFSALANLSPIDETLLEHIWLDLVYAVKFNFQKRAKRKALEMIRVYNQSRGRKGMFSAQLITTREELVATHKRAEAESKKAGFLGFSKPQHEVIDEGVDGEFTK